MPLDAYVFVEEAAVNLVDTVTQKRATDPDQVKEVRFIATITGPFAGFATVEVDERSALDGVLARHFRDVGAEGLQTAIPIRMGPLQVQHRPPPQPPSTTALVRIHCRAGDASAVLDATADLPGYFGSAIVLGDFDVLLELIAESADELEERILGGLGGLPGIHSSETALVLQSAHRDQE